MAPSPRRRRLKRGYLIAVRILFGFGISNLYVGLLFRLLHFPGWPEILTLGGILVVLAAILSLWRWPQVRPSLAHNQRLALRLMAVPFLLIVSMMGFVLLLN